MKSSNNAEFERLVVDTIDRIYVRLKTRRIMELEDTFDAYDSDEGIKKHKIPDSDLPELEAKLSDKTKLNSELQKVFEEFCKKHAEQPEDTDAGDDVDTNEEEDDDEIDDYVMSDSDESDEDDGKQNIYPNEEIPSDSNEPVAGPSGIIAKRKLSQTSLDGGEVNTLDTNVNGDVQLGGNGTLANENSHSSEEANIKSPASLANGETALSSKSVNVLNSSQIKRIKPSPVVSNPVKKVDVEFVDLCDSD